MKSLAHRSLQRNFFVAASVAVALFAAYSPQRSNAQSLTLDFQFDASSGGGTTHAVSAAGQVFTVDVFATVTGTAGSNPTTAQLQQLGIQLLRYAARSSMTGGGAFAVGPTSTTGANSGIGVTLGGASTIQNPFNNPGAIGPQGDFNGDGLNDLGGTSKTTISIAQNSASTQFAAGGGSPAQPVSGSQVGTSDAWRWLLETFTVTTGATAGKTGTTVYTPTVVGTGASTWTTDGATTADNITTWTPGTAITLTAAPTGQLADDSNTPGVYGTHLVTPVANGGTYAGIESKVVGLQNGPGGSNAAVFTAPNLGGDAKILAGTKSAAVTAPSVDMSWRTRLVGSAVPLKLDETHGGAGSALVLTTSTTGLVSNVLNLTGLETGTPNAGSTDPFVLDMSYNPALLPKGTKPNAAQVEATLAANGLIYMVSPTPGPDNGISQYVNTVLLNTGNVFSNPLDRNHWGYVGSYAQFQSAGQPGFNLTPGQELGSWGADPVTHEVWAVINHNSIFAVVPEPATIFLAGLGLLGLFGLRRTQKTA